MIKVLQIGMSYETGGTEVFLYNHYKEINKEEVQFDFVTLREDMAYRKEVEEMGATVHQIISARKNPILSFYQLIRIIEENDYDVLHLNISSFANIIPVLTAKLTKIPKIIIHSHNNGMEVSHLKFVLHHLNKHMTSKMKLQRLACSKSAGEFMFGKSPFEVFENAIDGEHFAYNEDIRTQTREEIGIEKDSFVIGNVGRLHSQKNQKYLIDVFAKYLKLNPNSYLLIVGTGDLKEKLEQQATSHGIRDRVILPGFSNDVNKYYQAMDIFCLPSIYEGLGIVGIEAQMSGLPCVFSDKCVPEVDISEKSIFLPLDDINEWVKQIEIINRTKENINRHLRPDKYDIKENAKKIEKIYKTKSN